MSREKHLEAMLNNAEKEIEALRKLIELVEVGETRALHSTLERVSINSLIKLKDVDAGLFYFVADKFDAIRWGERNKNLIFNS